MGHAWSISYFSIQSPGMIGTEEVEFLGDPSKWPTLLPLALLSVSPQKSGLGMRSMLEPNWTHLPARERDVRHLLGNPNPSFKSPAFGHCEMAGDAINLRIIKTIGCELVIRRQPFEHCRAPENEVRLISALSMIVRGCDHSSCDHFIIADLPRDETSLTSALVSAGTANVRMRRIAQYGANA
jgi:hypothetical protein